MGWEKKNKNKKKTFPSKNIFFAMQYLLLSVDVVLCVSLGLFSSDIAQVYMYRVPHRAGCKWFAVHGFGGWSARLEAALTRRRLGKR